MLIQVSTLGKGREVAPAADLQLAPYPAAVSSSDASDNPYLQLLALANMFREAVRALPRSVATLYVIILIVWAPCQYAYMPNYIAEPLSDARTVGCSFPYPFPQPWKFLRATRRFRYPRRRPAKYRLKRRRGRKKERRRQARQDAIAMNVGRSCLTVATKDPSGPIV